MQVAASRETWTVHAAPLRRVLAKPGSHSEPGDAGASVGLPQTNQEWVQQPAREALTPHHAGGRRQAMVLLRTSTWEMGAIAIYIPREMV